LRKDYEHRVQAGSWPAQETTVPLFPYQREGMLHLAFNERALLADEMGLGKSIQAIAACALLHRLNRARRVLIVTPASLKSEWEEQIRRFTPLAYQIVFVGPKARLRAREGRPPRAHHAAAVPCSVTERQRHPERHCRRPSEKRPVPTAGRPSGA
jgi:SNF2 family DNA or RNA helicase